VDLRKRVHYLESPHSTVFRLRGVSSLVLAEGEEKIGDHNVGATLNGSATAGNATTQYWFLNGTGKTALTHASSKTGALTGTTVTTVSAAIFGLKTKTTC